MSKEILVPTTVYLGKYRGRSPSRPGYVQKGGKHEGRVFLPPADKRHLAAWKRVITNTTGKEFVE